MRRLAAVAIALLLAADAVAAGVITAGANPTPDASPIQNAPAFTLPAVISGQPKATYTAPTAKPVLLTFFASWCRPCVEELPLIEAVARTQRIQVVGIDELDQRPDGPDLVRSTRVTFPSGYDHDGSVGAKFDLDGLPVNVFVAPDGRIVAYHRGQMNAGQLNALVTTLEHSNE